jgi:hypothetical protein
MKTSFNIGLWKLKIAQFQKTIFLTIVFDHCNVLSHYTTYALVFFILSQTLLSLKIQNFHIYQN